MPDPLGQSAALHLVPLALITFFTFARAGVQHIGNREKKQLEERQSSYFSRLLQTVNNPGRFFVAMDTFAALTALLLTDSVCAVFTGPFAGLLVRVGVHDVFASAAASVLLLALCAAVIMTVGVLLPAKIAALRPLTVLVAVYWPAWAISMLVYPLCAAADLASSALVRLLRVRAACDKLDVSEDEIRKMVGEGEVSGVIDSAEKQMIENVFEFNNMTAEDIMIHRTDIALIWEDDDEQAILTTIRESGLSRFPVCREDADDIVGLLSTRDYLLNYRLDQPKPLAELLRPALFVPESVRTDVLFRQMQRQKMHMAIVVDEYGGTSGLLTMEDLLEQLVGEIYDEFDSEEEQEIIPIGENLWRASGGAELDALSEAVGVDIPENEEYDTLGGLVFSHLTVIPDDGSHPEVEAFGLRLVVEELLDRRVEWVRVSKILDAQ